MTMRTVALAVWAMWASTAGAGDDAVRLVPAEGEGAKYWPRWRGPTGQGLAEGAYPDRWSATENVVWKTPVGPGNASPIVWADRVFLAESRDGGKERFIVAYDRATGKRLWECGPKLAPFADGTQRKNGFASATPTTDGQRVYAYFGNHGLFACDLNGKQAWHVELPRMEIWHGQGGSPLLYRDRVVIYQDCEKPGGFVAAFDRATGKQLWKTPRKGEVGWGTPVAVSVQGRDLIVVSSQDQVNAYDPVDGAPVWSCSGNTYEVIPTPVAGLGFLFCSSGRAGPTLAIRPDGKGDVTRTHVAWKASKGSPFVPSPLLVGERLYVVNDSVSVVTCFNARTGETLWKERCGEPVAEGFSASPVAVGGKVYFTNDEGDTFVLADGPTFRLLHVNTLGERTLASPALVDGAWYVRTEKHLWRLGTK